MKTSNQMEFPGELSNFDKKLCKGPFIKYVVKNRDFLAVCLSFLTTLLSENRQKSCFIYSLSVSFIDVVYEWSLMSTILHKLMYLINLSTKGGVGAKNPLNLVNVVCECPLR